MGVKTCLFFRGFQGISPATGTLPQQRGCSIFPANLCLGVETMRAVGRTNSRADFWQRRDDICWGCHSPALMMLLTAMAAFFVTGLAVTPVEAVCPTAALCR